VIPQSQFLVLAQVAAGRESELRGLLATMNSAPGVADPANALVPFGQFPQLHFARLVVLDDPSLGGIQPYGSPRPSLPVYLALLGSCDGAAEEFLAALAQRAARGLRRIFSHCQGFDANADLLSWMRERRVPLAASYVNWVGRSVRQIREEAAIARAVASKVDRSPIAPLAEAQQRRRQLIDFIDAEISAGRLGLTTPDPTPVRWQLARIVNLVGIPLIGLLLLPLFLILLPFALFTLRRKEESDPEICPRPDPAALLELQTAEDRDVSNQYTALGSVKPGLFRRGLEVLLLIAIDYACRHVFNRGYLARVQTIHFAFWALIDGKRRLVFASNYDGGHEPYMDDFINKVAWGLNLAFSSGVGWPRTRWLVARGARIEGTFKYYQRRHQLPTDTWYKAYPGLTLTDLNRNQRIREGLQREPMSDVEALAWLQLL